MIIYPKINIVRLYDLKKDPSEKEDLAKLKKYRKVMDRMFSLLEERQKATGDELDVKIPYTTFCKNN